MSGLLGSNRDIFFPKLSEQLHMITFSEIAERYLNQMGYEAYHCSSEEESRERVVELIDKKQWPCYFFKSDTTGEKDFEEFYTSKEDLDMHRFDSIGIIKNQPNFNTHKLDEFSAGIEKLKTKGCWEKQDLVNLFFDLLPDFAHKETGKYLDERMNLMRFFDVFFFWTSTLLCWPLYLLLLCLHLKSQVKVKFFSSGACWAKKKCLSFLNL